MFARRSLENISSLVLAVIVCTGLVPISGQAQPMDYPITRISDKIHVIYGPLAVPNAENHGFRNNVVIITTSAGMVVFDPGGSEVAGEMVVSKVKSITDAPIVAVFNCHAHGDHWLGNEGVKKFFPNVDIYGHPIMQAKVKGPVGEQWVKLINTATNGTAGGKHVVAPNKTVNDGDVVTIGDTKFRIYHTGRAHSDNDIMIEIVGTNILFVGDVVRNGMHGLMDEDASFKGNISAIDLIASKSFKLYIPGHGKAGGKEILNSYRGYLSAVYDTVKALYAKGMADFEMKPKVVEAAAAYKDWVGFDLRIGPHVSRAYLQVEAEAF